MASKITKSLVDKAEISGADYFLWDTDLKGFGLKVSAGGRKSYVCKYRVGRGRAAPTRRVTIGAHGSPWTPDAAREEARRILGLAANGRDPAGEKQRSRTELTVSELCELYIEKGIGSKKASTIATDKGRIERHIVPLIGKLKLSQVTKSVVKTLLEDIAKGKSADDVKTGTRGRAIVTGGKGTASRTVGLLGGIFTFAGELGLVDTNPVHGVKRYRDNKNQRFLTHEEFFLLGRALKQVETTAHPYAVAIIRLLALTGTRKGEIEMLKWSEVDLVTGYLHLADSKTGAKSLPLNDGALTILQQLPKTNGYVFPATVGTGHYSGTPKVWRQVRDAAGLPNLRLHDLRHSFASVAVSQGTSLPIIGGLLGHSEPSTTNRYAHLHNDPVKAASQAVSDAIANSIL
ncbi:tyrosine-type recombinase/integrase [Devosia sp. MC532]|uniref:tyrosine-type recombinase/integrase n=1 Tax=Devosia sp. MC532 TaxID=2799788 RepID=UPI0018F2E771|nr:site-specific integrase [Devosia sp. MC532]MBJ7579363.1 tyrosine-type recombinase/integrase [Devosia sp. MC532]